MKNSKIYLMAALSGLLYVLAFPPMPFNFLAFIFIIPISFIFGLEIISVAMQIISIRSFNKKIFLMSPVHHHFEMLGWKEIQIVTRFWIVHAAGMLISMSLLFLLIFLV